MNSKITKKITRRQCVSCKGYGLVKYEPLYCKYCDGKKCMYCNSSGFQKMPWDRCETCQGTGEIKSFYSNC